MINSEVLIGVAESNAGMRCNGPFIYIEFCTL